MNPVYTDAYHALSDCIEELSMTPDEDASTWEYLVHYATPYRDIDESSDAPETYYEEAFDEYDDSASVELMLGYVVDYVRELKKDIDKDVLIALVNANPDRFVLHCRTLNDKLGMKSYILELDREALHPTVISVKDWSADDRAKLNCQIDADEPSGGWYSYLDETGRKAIDKLIAENLSRDDLGKEGSFNLHWKNGERVMMGQHFIPVSVVTGSRGVVQEVTGVSITSGTPRAYIYSGDVGYAIDACEPLRDSGNKVETTYNLNSHACDEFYCAKCRKKTPVKDPTYCPRCGRRVI